MLYLLLFLIVFVFRVLSTYVPLLLAGEVFGQGLENLVPLRLRSRAVSDCCRLSKIDLYFAPSGITPHHEILTLVPRVEFLSSPGWERNFLAVVNLVPLW